MKKYAIILLAGLFLLGCTCKRQENKKVLAKVNNYEITSEEFEEEFKDSLFARQDTPESRKEFLDNLINRKLVLQEAQGKGLDKDKAFLKMIERFWEQSLLKLALDARSKQIAGSAFVNDKDIENVYQKMLKEGRTEKSYEQMYGQIKWEIMKLRESQKMNDWVYGLRKKADIKVNEALLK